MNGKVRITLIFLGYLAIDSVVLGSGVAMGFTHTYTGVVSSKSTTVPGNCITLSSGELECRDSLTQSLSISIR
jgi:hypothetical protein